MRMVISHSWCRFSAPQGSIARSGSTGRAMKVIAASSRAERMRSSRVRPSSAVTSSMTYASTHLASSKMWRYTRRAPNRKASLSSVITPSTSPSASKDAHCASASSGATTYGRPNRSSSAITSARMVPLMPSLSRAARPAAVRRAASSAYRASSSAR